MLGANKYEHILIGGGLMGSAAAYYLARRGCKALVLERRDQAAGTAGASDGVVGYHTKKPGAHMDLAMRSIAMFPGLSEELGADIEYVEKCGGMLLVEDEEQWALMESLAEEQRVSGVDIRMIGIHEAMGIEPQLSPRLLGALYSPDGGKVDPIKLTFAYASAAKRLGAVFQNGIEASSIINKKGRVVGVRTASGDFHSDHVVITSGAWSEAVGEMAGFRVPIKPRKGQILVTESMGPFVCGTAQCARYYVVKNRPDAITDEYLLRTGASLGIAQTGDGAVLIGSTREMAGFDRENTLESFEAIMRRAADFYPALRNAHVIRSFAGLRPYTPDGLPMIGRVGSVEGLYIAAGHEGDGIALAPITGKLLSEAIVDGKVSFPLEPFSPDRFG
jgi:sarcosine oxidase subunit beta